MSRRGFRLPPSKLTLRPAGKRKKVKFIHDSGLPGTSGSASSVSDCDTVAITDSSNLVCTAETTAESSSELTSYEIDSRALTASWESVRSKLVEAVVENLGRSPDQCCVVCGESAFLKCTKCGPFGHYCESCFEACHVKVNFMHMAEKWENDHYVPYVRESIKIDIQPRHICGTKKETKIQCIDENGKELSVLFTSCGCEALAVTLARAELWPATPSNPRCAFSFSLLDRAEGLLVEAQVSLKDFCNSLCYHWHFPEFKKKDIYPNLINSFEEYRFLRHKLRNMQQVSDDLNLGLSCPACPKNGGQRVYSMDGLFGLPRKKSAGVSHREPLLNNVYFYDQAEVDRFVSESEPVKLNEKSCSNFAAGNVLRSAKRYQALDETAVFGYCCRHEFPGKFISLKHGEKLAYGVFMLEKIMETRSSAKIFVMYDIACSLVAHLKKVGRVDILDATSICLPTFHCYGHKLSCQLVYSPRRCLGIGLSDGEGMERIWSYLRRFSRMSKEMRPSHRIDVLSGAIEYYILLKKKGLATLLLKRWDRCQKVHRLAEETLHDLMPDYCAEKESNILQWIEEEVKVISDHNVSSTLPQWKLLYFHNLQHFYSIRLQASSEGYHPINVEDISSVEKNLMEFERKHNISRWHPSDQEYLACKRAVAVDKKEQLLQQVFHASQRRAFLLQMKAKYADGQKIAKKLCSQISKETRGIQALVKAINEVLEVDPLCLAEALDPSTLKLRLQFLGMQPTYLVEERRKIVQAYLTLMRSKEELELLINDAKNVDAHYSNLRQHIIQELDRLECGSSFSQGTKALLHRHLTVVDELLRQSHKTVEVMLKSEPCMPALLDSDSSDSDCSDDDYD